MQIMLNRADLSKLQPETVADILALISPASASNGQAADDSDFYWASAVDLSINQVQHFMETASDPIVDGLRFIAQHGPIVTGADLLGGSKISTLKDFQGATTKRTRTVTKIDGATLLAWDNWNDRDKYEDGIGKYGVTNVTFDSLRRYFEM